jgi:uncharacterized protein YkwD
MKKIIFVFILFFSSFCQASDLHQEIYHKINHIRKSHNLPLLVLNAKLDMAAKSQSDWMAEVRRMDHLREKPSSFEAYKTCNHHPANRMINAGYFNFEDIFDVEIQVNGAFVKPKPGANLKVNEIIAAGKAPGHLAYNTDIIVQGWMKSPGHRKTILSSCYEEFGIGISSRNPGEVYWCVVFGSK